MSYTNEMRSVLWALDVRNERLPVGGTSAQYIEGIITWVDPLVPKSPDARWRNFRLRVMCVCPTCGVVMSRSRLDQHRWSARCNKTVLRRRRRWMELYVEAREPAQWNVEPNVWVDIMHACLNLFDEE